MSPAEYRAQAVALRKQAERSRDPAVREQMLLMVADWEKLAADAEELERRRRAENG
ncbi:hypothetical protein [Phenylobacterium sp. J367]|uniref:hypothetical protein n=1 Tax=Phenylobacterium sp. J367 TaxID=2898435 RepID=UPI002151E733|nr:hypothetical protein [Phenylobacterium sp. J367]MCR5878515.1 hypothetical protein [Phenylobacterium sp. J367]